MIDCPRCGFTQPKDQFCANCGVNMDAFSPKPKPIWHQLASSWYFLGAGVAIILIGVIWFMQSSSVSQPFPEKTLTRDAEFEEEFKKREQQEQQRIQAKRVNKKALIESQSAASQVVENIKKQAAQEAQIAQEKEDNKKDISEVQKLQIDFYEIERSALNEIIQLGTEVHSNSYSQSFLFGAESPAKALVSSKGTPLPGGKQQLVSPGSQIQLLFSNLSENSNVSWEFNLETVVTQVINGTAIFNLKSDFYFANGDSVFNPIETPEESFQISTQNLVLVVGPIPRDIETSEIQDSIPTNNPLKILSSNDFKEGLNEFIFVIQPVPYEPSSQ